MDVLDDTRDETLEDLPDGGAYGRQQRVGLVAGPVVLLLLLALAPPAGMATAAWHAAAVGLLMAVWWMTEAVPIPVTALVPLVLFPVLGVMPISETAAPYANPLIFLFMGGFMIALGMERWNLHRRLALRVILLIGVRPVRIVGGFMVASALLSMWISNTATAMMMLPIGVSVTALVHRPGDLDYGKNFKIVLMLAIAYACSIGGMATLIGTPTNAFLAGFMQERYGFEISFVRWMAVGLPLVVVGLAVIYVLLTRVIYPIRVETLPGGQRLVDESLQRLGPMTRPEKTVAAIFGATALLWMTRPLLQPLLPGLSDPGIAIGGALCLFVIPVDWRAGTFVLNWAWVKRLPWGVLLLFGGGLSLATAVSATGLAAWIGAAMAVLSAWPLWAIILVVVLVIVLLTELTSNTATVAAFLPVLASISIGIGQNPLLLLVPATIAASCAFMLPVATPPNAIIYGSGMITIPQMVRAGVVFNLIFVALVTVLALVLLPPALGIEFGVLPPWSAGP